MIAGLGPYPVMKDSGVPWLGEVPDHWRIARLKSSVSNVIEQTAKRESGDLYVALEHVESWTGRLRPADSDVVFDSQVKRFRSGDVLFGKLRPYLAKVACPTSDGVCVGEFLVLRPRELDGRSPYLEQFLRSKPVIDAVNGSTFGAKMPRADWQFVGGMAITLPPLPEQAAIVRFLDHADRRIRRYIRAKQKLIKLLEEQKQAIIHRAVTHGLDPNVRLKPSGVGWLGDVPEHWSRVPMRQLAARGRSTFVNGPFGSDLLTTELTLSGVPVIYIRDISRGSYQRVSKAHVTADKADSLKFCNVIAGDVLVAKVGDPPGTAATYPRGEPDGIVTQDVIRIRPDTSRVIADYLVTYLNSRAGRVAVGPVVVESTRGRVSLPDFRAVPIILPTLPEQRRILDEIANVTSDIGAAAVKAQHEIELLREYRTRLIADVVTGKLDVREEAARLPQEAEELEPLDETEALGEMGGESAADDLEPESQEVEA